MSIEYRNNIRKHYKSLTKEMQKQLFDKISNGDFSAREEVIHSCLPLVYDLAKKFHYNNRHVDLEDLIQHGNIALIKAVDNWNIKKATITTVATYYIRNSLIDMIKDSKYNIKSKYDMTRQAAEDISKIKSCGSVDPEEIVNLTGLTNKRVKLLLGIINGRRIDYTVMNTSLHSKDSYENVGDSNLNGCLADMISMIEDNIESQRDKDIFLTWIKYINKNNKTRIVAEKVNATVNEVAESIKKTKTTLKNIAREVQNA